MLPSVQAGPAGGPDQPRRLQSVLACGLETENGTIGALAVYGIAGEMAAEGDPGPGSFRTRLIDALDAISPARVRQQARLVVA